MTREEIDELIQQTKAESLNEEVVKESDLETLQKQSYAKGWNACNNHWIQNLNEYCQEPILDKIRAEIEQNAYPIVHGVNNHEKGMTLYGILQIIDKYKAERERAE